MTLTINDTAMTSSQSAHADQLTPSGHGWKGSWLPGRILDGDAAIAAMTVAGTAERDLHEGHRLWLHILGCAAERGLTRHDAVARASQPPGDIRTHQGQNGERPDPEVAE